MSARLLVVAALLAGEWSVLERVPADDWRILRSNGQILTKDQYLADLRSGDLVYDRIEHTDVRIRVYGDAAVVTGVWESHWSDRGVSHEGRGLYTHV